MDVWCMIIHQHNTTDLFIEEREAMLDFDFEILATEEVRKKRKEERNLKSQGAILGL